MNNLFQNFVLKRITTERIKLLFKYWISSSWCPSCDYNLKLSFHNNSWCSCINIFKSFSNYNYRLIGANKKHGFESSFLHWKVYFIDMWDLKTDYTWVFSQDLLNTRCTVAEKSYHEYNKYIMRPKMWNTLFKHKKDNIANESAPVTEPLTIEERRQVMERGCRIFFELFTPPQKKTTKTIFRQQH